MDSRDLHEMDRVLAAGVKSVLARKKSIEAHPIVAHFEAGDWKSGIAALIDGLPKPTGEQADVDDSMVEFGAALVCVATHATTQSNVDLAQELVTQLEGRTATMMMAHQNFITNSIARLADQLPQSGVDAVFRLSSIAICTDSLRELATRGRAPSEATEAARFAQARGSGVGEAMELRLLNDMSPAWAAIRLRASLAAVPAVARPGMVTAGGM